MATVKQVEDPERNPRVKAVFDDIRATRKTDFVSNLWRTLAFDPPLLENIWSEVKGLMATPTHLEARARVSRLARWTDDGPHREAGQVPCRCEPAPAKG